MAPRNWQNWERGFPVVGCGHEVCKMHNSRTSYLHKLALSTLEAPEEWLQLGAAARGWVTMLWQYQLERNCLIIFSFLSPTFGLCQQLTSPFLQQYLIMVYTPCAAMGEKTIYQGEKLGKTRFLANFLGIHSFTPHFQEVKVDKM